MADFRVDTFKGIRPRLSSRLLPNDEAQTSQNTRLGSGQLEPWNAIDTTAEPASYGAAVVHLMRNAGVPIWLMSTNDVNYAPGPVANDALERTYYTGEAQPRMTYTTIAPTDYRYLGIPAPTTPPTLVGEALPADVVTGTMSDASMSTNVLKADFVIEDNLPANMNYWMFGDDSGYDTLGAVHVFDMDFYVGQEIRVASVVDANTITIEDANGAAYLARTVQQDRVNAGISSLNKMRTDDTGTGRDGYFRFYVPNGVEITITSHGLEVGDIIRITSIPSTVSLHLTQTTGGTLFGAESDNGAGTAGSNTWPADPVSVAADGFWIAGARAYPFVDVWAGATGPAFGTDFVINGNFAYELITRDGVDYADFASNIESRVYVYTFVSELGEEGPPSPPSDEVTIPSAGEVEVSAFEAPPTTQRNITHMRIYRANTGSEQTVFQFVAEIADPFAAYDDTVLDIDLGEILQTESWDPPPADLVGLIALPNGGMAGFTGKTVCFAEPYYPHAWPPQYQIAVDHEIVGLGIVPNGVAILTKGPVYIASGDHPRAMSTRHFNDSQACMSKRSIANTINGVLYAAPDGLAFVGSSGFKLVTQEYATKREWQASFEPSALKGFWHDSKYIGFHSTGGFVFDPNDPAVGLSTHNQIVDAAYLDTENDILYVVGSAVLSASASSVLMTVATSQSGSGDVVKMSTAGVFTACGPSGTGLWRGVAYDTGHATWVIVSSAGSRRISYTTNEGTSWADGTVSGGGSQTYLGVAYSPTNNRLVAVSSAGTGRIVYSDDGGANWTAITSHDAYAIQNVYWDKYRELFVAISTTAGSNIITSPTGLVWTTRTTPNPASVGGFLGVTAEGTVMSANSASPQPRSTDNVTWAAAPNHSDDKIFMAGGPDTIVASGSTGTSVTSDRGSTAWVTPSVISGYGPLGYSEQLEKWYAFPASTGGSTFYTAALETALVWTSNTETLFSGKNWHAIGFGVGTPVIGIWDGDATTQLILTWKSGRIRTEYPLNLGAARIHADEYPVTFRLYNDQGTLVTTRTITSDGVIRLPGGYLTSWFEVELEGNKGINTVHVAETVQELLEG